MQIYCPVIQKNIFHRHFITLHFSQRQQNIVKIFRYLLAYYIYTISILPFTNLLIKNDILKNEFLIINKQNSKPFLNSKLIRKYLTTKKYFQAYRAFWATWNPITHYLTKQVYNMTGGSNNHRYSTIASFVFSGIFLHGLHPYIITVYLMLILLPHCQYILPYFMITMTCGYALLSLPLLIKTQ